MNKTLKVAIIGLVVGLIWIGITPLQSVPQADLANEPLSKTILFDGGYIPHLEL